jgi:hypothetical protein
VRGSSHAQWASKGRRADVNDERSVMSGILTRLSLFMRSIACRLIYIVVFMRYDIFNLKETKGDICNSNVK